MKTLPIMIMITAIQISSGQLLMQPRPLGLTFQIFKFDAAPANISDGCFDALYNLSSFGGNDPNLVTRYWSSWGKPPIASVSPQQCTENSSNIPTYFGYYDQCIGLEGTTLGEMRYCLYPMLMSAPGAVNVQMNMGICYPVTCSIEEFAVALSQGILATEAATVNSNINDDCDIIGTTTLTYDKDPDRSISCPIIDVNNDLATKLILSVCIALISLVIIGSLLECSQTVYVDQDHDQHCCHGSEGKAQFDGQNCSSEKNNLELDLHDNSIYTRILVSFSLIKNVSHLFSVNPQSSNTIKAVSGIRVISLLWVIAHHTWRSFHSYIEFVENKEVFLSKVKEFSFQPIINATFSVEMFLLLSGLLVAYTAFKDLDKYGKFRIFYFYVYRFFRIAPVYYLVIFLAIKVVPKLGSGPVYNWRLMAYDICQQYWWTNVVFINNFIPVWSCLGHTWYMAIDMQFFIISPVFIVLLYRKRSVGLAVITAVMIGSTIIVGIITIINNHKANLYADSDFASNIKYLYCKPYFRINAYLIGIVLGYILHKKYNITSFCKSVQLQNLVFTIMWMLSGVLCLPVLYGTYKTWHDQPFSEIENVSYMMFSRTAWCTGVAIVIFMCNRCYDRFIQRTVNGILSWDGWNPLVKLTYTAFLVHFVVLDFVMGTLQSSFIYTDYVFVTLLITVTMLSYFIGVLLVLCAEFTIINVVMVIFTAAGVQPRQKLFK